MPPFDTELTPVALPDEAVRVVPDENIYRVAAVEQLATIGPVDYGSASSGGNATDSNGGNFIDLEGELEMSGTTLGQFWVNPLSDVEVEVRQTGQQDQRFVNSNQVGLITPRTPANQRVVYVFEDEAPLVQINNPQTWDMDKTLVYYTGFKLHLHSQPLSPSEAEQLAGQPAAVPTDTLKREYGGA